MKIVYGYSFPFGDDALSLSVSRSQREKVTHPLGVDEISLTREMLTSERQVRASRESTAC